LKVLQLFATSRSLATMKRHNETQTAASDLMNEIQAAEYLQITPRTCREWRSRRGLPALKPTAKITRYRKSDIDDWLARSRVSFPPRARRVAPATPPPRSSCKAAAPGNESVVQNA